MPAPAVSVCIPTFNGAAFLDDCLRSVRSQSFSDFEIVIVDDNSTDATIAIAAQHADDDPRIQIFEYKTHSGLGGAGNYNRCIEHSHGEWIKYVFQDDLLAPKCLERMLETTNAESCFVACWKDFLFSPDTPHQVRDEYLAMPDLKSVFGEHNRVDATTFCHAVLARWQKNFVGEPTSMLIHRDCFEQYGQFNPDIATFADMECWIRVGSHEGLTIVPEILATFRIHEASMSGIIRSARQYRAELERVLLCNTLAFSDQYATLRAHAARVDPPIDPIPKLVQVAQDVRWLAIHAKNSHNDSTLLTEWENFCQYHPHITKLLPKTKETDPSLLTRIKKYIAR
ncbi:MAG: glycosyltransferase [Gammaproteobacteria bacterium]|nr:glycosyltransferase [Gammaproteobacteria bacterium]